MQLFWCPMPRPSEDSSIWDDASVVELRNLLYHELALQVDLWKQYQHLYMSSPQRVTLLNEHAKWFFATVQRAYLNELILGISRLTDPSSDSHGKNVVLEALLSDSRVIAKPAL